jgi:hypothetical protein
MLLVLGVRYSGFDPKEKKEPGKFRGIALFEVLSTGSCVVP